MNQQERKFDDYKRTQHARRWKALNRLGRYVGLRVGNMETDVTFIERVEKALTNCIDNGIDDWGCKPDVLELWKEEA